MSFLKKIFGRQDAPTKGKDDKHPDNTRLIYLLNIYGEHNSEKNYEQVLNEILDGNAYLLLPTINDGKNKSGSWTTNKVGDTLKLTSIHNLDGLKAIAVFSDEKALFDWAKKTTEYTAVPTQVLPDLCRQMGIVSVVINSGQKNMFVVERNLDNFKSRTILKETPVKIGAPSQPLSPQIIKKLAENFKNVSTIEAAYQYAQLMDQEFSIVLGICLSSESDNSKTALHNAISNALEGEVLKTPVDLMVLNNFSLIDSVKNIPNALFYSR
jgi:type III secretion system (T3SS) SseB-like protein